MVCKKKFGLEEGQILKDKYLSNGDSGKYNLDEIVSFIANDFNLDKNEIYDEWFKLGKVDNYVLDVLSTLKNKGKLILVSNVCPGLFEFLHVDNLLKSYFDVIIKSCDLKICKPSFKIYQYALDQFKINFNKIYMVDDNLNNLKDLEKLNIIPVYYKNHESLNILFNN